MVRTFAVARRIRRTPPLLRVERLEDRNLPSGAPLSAFDNLQVNIGQYNPNDLIVALRTDTGYVDLSAVAPSLVLRNSPLDLGSGLFRVDLQPGVSVAQAQAFFQAQSFVRYTSPDYVVSVQTVPNDPSFTQQWGLNNTGQTGGVADADIDAPEAWDVATGSGNTVVAIIDTGVDYTHPDLAANIWTNPGETAGDGIDNDGNGYIDDIRGWDFVNNDNNPIDDNGHGSHVAGIIGAVGNNGVGVAGVNWSVKMMPVKFLSASGSGSLSNAVLALNYAVGKGAKISNNSWGGGGFYQPMADAINNAKNAGHIFVAAAGNSSSNNDTTANYPSNYNFDNVVAVASTTASDGLSSFSNYGATTVELGAPGSSIYSTYKDGTYATLSGTSMATPFVTGAMALVKDMHPTWTYDQIIRQVVNNTDPIAALAGKTITGGRLNLYKALTAGQSDVTGPKVTSAVFSGADATSFNKVRLTFNEAIDSTSFTTGDIVSFTRGGVDITGVTFTVTAVSSTVFDVGFTAQSALGTYALTVGPFITDVASPANNMDQNGNSTNGEVPGDRYTATGVLSASQTFNSTDVPKNLPDRATTTSVLTGVPSLTIGKITVKLNITHTYDSDLKISLKSPTGTSRTLVNRRGGSGDNFTNTVFDDAAATSITSGVAPFSGTYRPEQTLSAFNNQNAGGTWTLTVQDLGRFDVGVLNSWSITITSAGGGASTSIGDGGGLTIDPTVAKDMSRAIMWHSETAPAPSARVAETSRVADPPQAVRFDDVARPPAPVHDTTADLVIVVSDADPAPGGDWLDYTAEAEVEVAPVLIGVN